MIIAALKSNVLHRLWSIINRIKDHGLEHDELIYVHHIFCLEYGRAHIVLENEKNKNSTRIGLRVVGYGRKAFRLAPTHPPIPTLVDDYIETDH